MLAAAVIWTEQPIHFLDFEGSLISGVVEYGVVTVRVGEVEAAATRLCRPTGRLRAEDVAVHGLQRAELAVHEPLAADFDRFAAWRESGPFAAHFAGVENALLKSVWPYPRAVPDFARPERRQADWGPWIDTGALYRQIYPQLVSLKLAEVVAASGLQDEVDELAAKHCPPERRRYHAALYDALAGAVLLNALAHEPQVARLSVRQLLALSTLDGERRDQLRQDAWF